MPIDSGVPSCRSLLATVRTAVSGLLIGLLLLCLAELVLHLAGIGHSNRLFLSGGHSQRELLYLNGRFANQYYPRLLPSIPTPGKSVLFERHKDPETFRIFVLGESTSQGFPYGATEAFSFQLEQMLTRAGVRCEVINLSMSAITSYVGLDMAREVAELSPDLVLVYFGHNEFLGIGGNASHTSPRFQLNQLASRLRIYQVLKRLLSPDGDLPASLLEIMANVPGTALGDQSYEATLTAYGQSLKAIIDVLSSVQAEVLILGVARNLRDFPPFRSEIRRSQSEKDDLAARLDRLVVSGQPLPGVTQIEDALTSYALGKALLRSGRHQQARQYLERACDLDQLRFRASTGIRHVAREICREGPCGYLDLQPIVDELSPEGIAGNDTFVDQVHPSLAVHDLLARTLADLILRRHFADVVIDSSFAKIELRSTLVDRIKAASTLETLYRTAMFKELGYHNELAQRAIFRASETIGEHRREVLPGIRRRDVEYIQSVYASFPAAYQLHISYGAWLIKQRRHQEAFAEFRQAATLNRFSISARSNLALMHTNRGRYDEALAVLQELIDLDIDDPRLWESVYRVHVLAGRKEEAQKLKRRLPGDGEILEDSRGLRLYEF